MKTNTAQDAHKKLQRVICVLIIAIFAAALVIASIRLMAWNKERREIAKREARERELAEEIAATEHEIARDVDEDYVKDHTGTADPGAEVVTTP